MEMFGEGTSSRSSENDKMDRMMAMIEQVAKSQSEMRTQVIDISDRQARLEALPQSSQQVESPIQNPVQPQIPLVIQREEVMGEPVNNQVGKLLAEFNKLRPTSFGGSSDPNAAENWLLDMDSMLEPMECNTFQRVMLVTFMLRGAAKIWWRSVKDVQTEPLDWARFQELFLEKYVTESARDRKHQEFMNLVQGNLTVSEYEERFTALSRYGPEQISTDAVKAKKFIRGLKTFIRGKLAPFQIRSYIEAVSKALSIEREDEDIQATRGQVGRIRQFPQQFQMRQDPNKRQVVPTSSGQLSYRPVRQQWQAVRPVVSQPGQPATRPSAPAQNNQFVPRGVQPPPVRPQGQVVRPQGQIIRLQQMGFSAPQTQGTLYTIVTEDTPVEEMPQEDALFYAITQEDASASDQVVEETGKKLSLCTPLGGEKTKFSQSCYVKQTLESR
ncbi:hypothetical protein BVC80_8071g6 [Macleaya cordata]|uniref:Retrotransposon gag domain-containing protein n=1 Tax=Macleaya cordata TaxID=56857 RepID=A0A200R804_MACCD|nr:hypothetical protein BVC80_8071g6 [Macleaya cordata]